MPFKSTYPIQRCKIYSDFDILPHQKHLIMSEFSLMSNVLQIKTAFLVKKLFCSLLAWKWKGKLKIWIFTDGCDTAVLKAEPPHSVV